MADQMWGRAYLELCGIDPDDPADVRSAYESCHEAHVEWILTGVGEIDYETLYMLVDAITNANGWLSLPLDWKAPYMVVLPPGGLRDAIPRRRAAGTAPEDRLPSRRNPRIGCATVDGTWIHGRPHDCPAYTRLR